MDNYIKPWGFAGINKIFIAAFMSYKAYFFVVICNSIQLFPSPRSETIVSPEAIQNGIDFLDSDSVFVDKKHFCNAKPVES